VDSAHIPLKKVFGSLKNDPALRPCSSPTVNEPRFSAQRKYLSNPQVQNVSKLSSPDLVSSLSVCSRCLGLGHSYWAYLGTIRCKRCFAYGHFAKLCHCSLRPK
jgi:hypothetical protein